MLVLLPVHLLLASVVPVLLAFQGPTRAALVALVVHAPPLAVELAALLLVQPLAVELAAGLQWLGVPQALHRFRLIQAPEHWHLAHCRASCQFKCILCNFQSLLGNQFHVALRLTFNLSLNPRCPFFCAAFFGNVIWVQWDGECAIRFPFQISNTDLNCLSTY
jgi:hypothetical protein